MSRGGVVETRSKPSGRDKKTIDCPFGFDPHFFEILEIFGGHFVVDFRVFVNNAIHSNSMCDKKRLLRFYAYN